MTPNDHRTAIDSVIEVFVAARERPHMFFRPADDPAEVIRWISGFRVGFAIFGLQWNCDCRRQPLDSRHLEFLADWEDRQLATRGLKPSEIVHELLTIEIEMWELQRASTPASH